MNPTTKRTPALAYVAAVIALLLVWAGYRPLLYAWKGLQQETPSTAAVVELLRSPTPERQREGVTLAARMKPVTAEALAAVSELAFTAPDTTVRQQAAAYLAGIAQQQALPPGFLAHLPALTPDMDRQLAATYATLIQHVAANQAPPPNAVAFLDAVIEQGDWSTQTHALRALGQIGFFHGLDDSRVAGLTTMATRESVRGQPVDSAEAVWALKLVGQKRALPPATVDALVVLMREGRDARARELAVKAVATQLPSMPALADAIEAALADPDARVRGAARNALYELESARPADLDQALRVAADADEPGTRRLRALQRLLQEAPADDRVRATVQRLWRSEDAVLRAGVASMAGALPDSEAEALFAAAVVDADPQVRAAAVLPLIARRAVEGEEAQVSLIERLLSDRAPEVQRNVLVSVRSHELNSDPLRSALRNMAPADEQVARDRAALLESLELAARTALQRFADAALDPKRYGAYAFVALAVLAALVCLAFLLNYTARFFVYLSARRWRALAALGIAVAWVGTSAALGWAFFVGAFVAGGHNSAPPLGTQFSVVGILLLLVVVYALLGYGLRRLVRV